MSTTFRKQNNSENIFEMAAHDRTYSTVIAFFLEREENPFELVAVDEVSQDGGQPLYMNFKFPLHLRICDENRRKFAQVRHQNEALTAAIFCRIQDDNEAEKVQLILEDLNARIQPFFEAEGGKEGYLKLVDLFVEKISTGYNYPKKDEETGKFVFGYWPATGPPYMPKVKRLKEKLSKAALPIAEILKRNFGKAKHVKMTHLAGLVQEVNITEKDPLDTDNNAPENTINEASGSSSESPNCQAPISVVIKDEPVDDPDPASNGEDKGKKRKVDDDDVIEESGIKKERIEVEMPSSTNRIDPDDEAIEAGSTMKDIEEQFKRNDAEITGLKKRVQDLLLDKVRIQKALNDKMKSLKEELSREKAQNLELTKRIDDLQREIEHIRTEEARDKVAKLEKLTKVFFESTQKVFNGK